jgi:hypothetical protein
MDGYPVPFSTVCSDLLFDDQILARRARTTLAGADTALLSAGHPCNAGCPPVVVRVMDDDGEPLVFACNDEGFGKATDGQATDGQGRPALETLCVPPSPTFGVWLALHGRLHQIRHESAPVVVRLSVDRVGVGCPHRPVPSARGYRMLPLETYALARPNLVAARVPRPRRP